MSIRVWHACLCLGAALQLMAATPTRVRAEDTVRATVVLIDGDEIVVDLGRAQLPEARPLTVFRTLEVRHPITRKLLRDRFAIATLEVLQPGTTLSVMKLREPPSHPVAVGDAVEVVPQPAAAAPPPPRANIQAPAPSTLTQPERELLRYWHASLSQPPEKRAALYSDFLLRHPQSPYGQFVQSEVEYLRRLHAELSRPSNLAMRARGFGAIEMLPLTGATAGSEAPLAARVRATGEIRAVMLHIRALDATGYRSLHMELDPRGHVRARVPRDLVRAPGFAYFLEVIGSEGKPVAALGSAREPKIAVVAEPNRRVARRERATRVHFSTELASFDGTSGRDYFFINEGDFLYRVRRGPLYGVRMGYGHFAGEGGTVEELDVRGLAPRPAGFSYGFFETELELHRLFGAAIRGTIGLGRPDASSTEQQGITGGVQLRARIGEADGTHLVLAGELMPEIGQRAYIGLVWEAIARVPMATEIVVTDQPVNSDELAVRLLFEAGYRFSDRITVSLRPSYQLRTIRHAGPGIGMAATFDW